METSESIKYTLKIENFEGPLALLYHLVEKNKMNIYDIKINEIADQYLAYIKEMERLDLEVTSEFVLMASTLLYIKSRSLLPTKKDLEEDEEVDPEEEIVRKLIEYKKYKEISSTLKEREGEWQKVFYNIGEEIKYEKERPLEQVSINKLFSVYKRMLVTNEKKSNKDVTKMDTILQYEKVSLKSKVREVLKALMKSTIVNFNKMFCIKSKSRVEVVTGFMAILDLARNSKVELTQNTLFGDILIKRKYKHNIDIEESERDEQ